MQAEDRVRSLQADMEAERQRSATQGRQIISSESELQALARRCAALQKEVDAARQLKDSLAISATVASQASSTELCASSFFRGYCFLVSDAPRKVQVKNELEVLAQENRKQATECSSLCWKNM